MQFNTHLVFAPRFGPFRTISIDKATKHLHYIVQIVGGLGSRDTKISASIEKSKKNVEKKSQKAQSPKRKSVNTVEEVPLTDDSTNFLQSSTGLYETDYSSGDDNMVAAIHNDLDKIEPLNMPIKIKNISTTLLVVSGSACSTLNKSTTARVVNSKLQAIWAGQINKQQLRLFPNQPIQN